MATIERMLSGGPSIRGFDPWVPGKPSPNRSHQLLTDEERAQLATIASVVRFKKGDVIYLTGEPAKSVFNIIGGVVKTYLTSRMGQDSIAAFLYPEDLFGLAKEGKYENSARALTPVTAYAFPATILRNRLLKNAALEFHFIAKLCNDLREAQRHAFLLSQKHAATKMAMFLQLQENIQPANAKQTEIYLPMARSDIADYVGLSPAAVSRAFRYLAARGVIKLRKRRHVKIIDHNGLEKIACQ
jgi:CRP/FNR family transcriptional regulator, anaerobic regulatory protein